MKKNTLQSALASLMKKNDVRISGDDIMVLSDKAIDPKTGEPIDNPRKQFDLGNGSWGKISYLVNYHGYRQYFVSEF